MNQETTNLFSNGMEFLYPRTEDGPSLYGLLEGAWLFAALVQGIRTKVWRCDPTQPNPVASAWARQGLIAVLETDGKKETVLTKAGQNVVACAGLLEYEFSMMQQQLSGDFVTDPAKYAGLRTALGNYAEKFLPDMHDWVVRQAVMDGGRFFDFCGGDGGYLVNFLRKWPCAQGMLFDRAPGCDADAILNVSPYDRMGIKAGDAFGSDEFFAQQAGAYDIVLMSEILHCKGPTDRQLLLRRAGSLLKPGGVVLIIEQHPNLRLDWRMQDMTQGGECLSEQQICIEADAAGFIAESGIRSVSHYGIRLEKAE